MTETDRLYLKLYVKMKRLMSLNARENKEDISTLMSEIKSLRATGSVSQKAIELAPYQPWR